MDILIICILALLATKLIDLAIKFWVNRSTGVSLENILEKVKSGETVDLEEEKYGKISATENELIIDRETSIPYERIISIDAYKRDILTTDLICIAFNFLEGKEELSLEIHEHMKGYKESIDQLPNIFQA
tara:strand:- start:895 stop:1284 length:390 start_codon:yes stop_codon:yes gene_type:complete